MGPVDFISMYRSNRGKGGHDKTAWTASTQIYLAGYKGTPGAKERPGVKTFDPSAVSSVGGLQRGC